jgi:hypothetical protein
VIPPFQASGELPEGVHWADWHEIEERFGGSDHRGKLLSELLTALRNLRRAGCETAYVDGSFVTGKGIPGDFDACWDPSGVDPYKLDPVLLTFDPGRARQKEKYLGELFPSTARADARGSPFLDFFQISRETDDRKESS